jgi:hypothetical protein
MQRKVMVNERCGKIKVIPEHIPGKNVDRRIDKPEKYNPGD